MWHLDGRVGLRGALSHIRSTEHSARCGLDGYRRVPKDGGLLSWETVLVHVAEVEKAMPPPEHANVVLFDCLLVAVGVGHSIQIHHRQAREVAEGAAVPGSHQRALRQQAVHHRHAHVGTHQPVFRLHLVSCGIDEPKRRREIHFRGENRRRRDDRRQAQNVRRARQPRRHETADEVDADAAPQRHDERLHQIRRHEVPPENHSSRMHEKNALRELGQMARGQAENARHEGQQQRVLSAAGTARQPPNQERVDADLQRGEEFVVEGFRPRKRLDALRQAVAAFPFPLAL